MARNLPKVKITFFNDDDLIENYQTMATASRSSFSGSGTANDALTVVEYINSAEQEMNDTNVAPEQRLQYLIDGLSGSAQTTVSTLLAASPSTENLYDTVRQALLDKYYGSSGLDGEFTRPLFGNEYNTTIFNNKKIEVPTGRTVPVCVADGETTEYSNSDLADKATQALLGIRTMTTKDLTRDDGSKYTMNLPNLVDKSNVSSDGNSCAEGYSQAFRVDNATDLGVSLNQSITFQGAGATGAATSYRQLLNETAFQSGTNQLPEREERVDVALNSFCGADGVKEVCDKEYAFCKRDGDNNCVHNPEQLNTKWILSNDDRQMIAPPMSVLSSYVNKRADGNLTDSTFRSDLKDIIQQCSGILEANSLFRTSAAWNAAKNKASQVEARRRQSIRNLVLGK